MNINEILDCIVSGKFSVLCGAGISRDSKLPTVDEFYDYLLPRLFLSDDHFKFKQLIKTHRIPFERIMEIIITYSNESSLLNIFNSGSPNLNHLLLGEMFSSELLDEVYTTNFDSLFESSIKTLISKPISSYGLFYKEASFSKLHKGNIKKIVKIHGSSHDLKSIRIFLSLIVSETKIKSRRQPIQRLFNEGNHNSVLVLGYSFSDVFDINPFIEQLKETNKLIIVIEHPPENNSLVKVEDINLKQENNPFKNIRCKGYRIHINTRLFLKLIWSKINPKADVASIEDKIDKSINNSNFNWVYLLDKWLIDLGKTKTSYLAGVLWNNFHHYSLAIPYLSRANRACGIAEETDLYFAVNTQLLLSHHRSINTRTDFNRLWKKCEKVLHNLENHKHCLEAKRYNLIRSDLYFRLGRIAEDNLDNSREALKYYYKSYKVDYRNNDLDGMSKSLHQIGTIYSFKNETKLALKCLRKGRRIKKKLGNIGGVARSNYEIGNAYFINGNHKAAYNYYTKAEQQLNSGEVDLMGFILSQKAVIEYNNENFEEARRLHLIKAGLTTTNQNQQSKAILYYNLARCERELGNHMLAMSLLKKAKRMHYKLNRMEYFFRDCQEIAFLFMLNENFTMSILYLNYLEQFLNSDFLTPITVAHYYLYSAYYCKKNGDLKKYKEYITLSGKLFRHCLGLKTFRKLKLKYNL